MSVARFRVKAPLDSAGGDVEGTVTIYRDIDRVEIRPLRSRHVYVTTLGAMATNAIRNALYAQQREARLNKKKARVRA